MSMLTSLRTSAAAPPVGSLLQRKCSCGANASDITGQCEDCQRKQALGLQRQPNIGAVDDPLEHEADRVADAVLRMPEGGATPAMGTVAGQAQLRRLPAISTAAAAHDHNASLPATVNSLLQSPGETLPTDTRRFFEPRFAHDFSRVRVHVGSAADASARAVGARAYTVGQHLAFAKGEFQPGSTAGKRLLAHELTHVLQQDTTRSLQRAPAKDAAAATPDPLCKDFDLADARKALEALIHQYDKDKNLLPLIRNLKWFRRCATEAEQTAARDELAKRIPPDEAKRAWDESAGAFGGYVGFRPGYAPDVDRHLKKLGTSETLASETFELTASKSRHRRGAKAAAAADMGDLERTDIVYFRGHQYAQYKAPGLFANGSETRGFDLRYVEKVGGFANVKLMISTSCATLCQEAVGVFRSLFPNAIILGYRKSAPIDGAGVRNALTKRINAINRPLLLDQPVDVSAIIDAWRAVIESRHKGHERPVPGYLQGNTVTYWDGKAWHTITANDAANACKVKGNYTDQYPNPP
ncbi:MAG: DUF4157 domain-containing protein [Zoogloeaceae bacterium]|nr:DUF4157 domain-containing protein [Zoogloeaceae bacterium]